MHNGRKMREKVAASFSRFLVFSRSRRLFGFVLRLIGFETDRSWSSESLFLAEFPVFLASSVSSCTARMNWLRMLGLPD